MRSLLAEFHNRFPCFGNLGFSGGFEGRGLDNVHITTHTADGEVGDIWVDDPVSCNCHVLPLLYKNMLTSAINCALNSDGYVFVENNNYFNNNNRDSGNLLRLSFPINCYSHFGHMQKISINVCKRPIGNSE